MTVICAESYDDADCVCCVLAAATCGNATLQELTSGSLGGTVHSGSEPQPCPDLTKALSLIPSPVTTFPLLLGAAASVSGPPVAVAAASAPSTAAPGPTSAAAAASRAAPCGVPPST